LFCGSGRLFDFGLLPLISLNNIKSPKAMCRMRADTKSMTGKTTEGLAWGVSKRAIAAGAGGILRTREYTSKAPAQLLTLIYFYQHGYLAVY
jgi:hypothetical protein